MDIAYQTSPEMMDEFSMARHYFEPMVQKLQSNEVPHFIVTRLRN